MRVYAGIDPITKKRHYLIETVPAGPKAEAQAEKVRTRLLSEVDEKRSSRTNATVDQLVARYLDVLKVETTTRAGYERLVRLYIRPVLGDLPIGRVTGETADSFYAQLRKCRGRCRGNATLVDHRTDGAHECDHRCGPHQCTPLGEAYLRQIHNVLNGAFNRGVKWRWLGVNPLGQAKAPTPPPPDPQPPSPAQAARIAAEAWKDPEWGILVWLAMTTGARRGELCALRWDRIDFAASVVNIRTSIAQTGGRTWEKDTKTHQRRRIVLDVQTLTLLRAYLQFCAERAATLGVDLPDTGYVFSPSPDGSTWPKPDSITQRYGRMCERLGLDMHIHQLRSATSFAAGVDIRTVAGRLGHSGGGTTTLRVYSAWVAEADQRAANSLSARMPELPASMTNGEQLALPAAESAAEDEDDSPYLRIAADLRAAIRCGALRQGEPLPTNKDLAARYRVSVATAHRALSVLTGAGEAMASRGKRATVA